MIYQYVSPAVKRIYLGRVVEWKYSDDGMWYCLSGEHGLIWAPARECFIQTTAPQRWNGRGGATPSQRGAQREGAAVPSP